jgi:putative transposase
VNKFGPLLARKLKKKHSGYGDTSHIDEVFIKINGKQHYLWRAVDQDGDVVDVLLQTKRDGKAAKRFFKRILKFYDSNLRQITTDKLHNYNVAHRKLAADVMHTSDRYNNNRAEQSHQVTRAREQGIQKLKSIKQGNQFLSAHKEVYNLFN